VGDAALGKYLEIVSFLVLGRPLFGPFLPRSGNRGGSGGDFLRGGDRYENGSKDWGRDRNGDRRRNGVAEGGSSGEYIQGRSGEREQSMVVGTWTARGMHALDISRDILNLGGKGAGVGVGGGDKMRCPDKNLFARTF
jgi:hypothetical protein